MLKAKPKERKSPSSVKDVVFITLSKLVAVEAADYEEAVKFFKAMITEFFSTNSEIRNNRLKLVNIRSFQAQAQNKFTELINSGNFTDVPIDVIAVFAIHKVLFGPLDRTIILDLQVCNKFELLMKKHSKTLKKFGIKPKKDIEYNRYLVAFYWQDYKTQQFF